MSSVRYKVRALPTRACSNVVGDTADGRRRSESIGITPIGWSGDLFSSAGGTSRRADRHVELEPRFFSSVAMWMFGLRISTPDGRSMSAAVISPDRSRPSAASISGRVGVHAAGRSPFR